MLDMLRVFTLTVLAAVGLIFAPTVHAEQNPPNSDQSRSMMDGMHGGGMMGMMNMMGRRGEMMDGCSNMMQSHHQPPNSQFHKRSEPPKQEQ